MGIISCLGNDLNTVTHALQTSRSGLRYVPEYASLGLRSCIAGIPDISNLPPINRKTRRFMGDAALYAHYAMEQALSESQLNSATITSPRTGLIVGSGVGSPFEHTTAMDIFRTNGLSKVLPYAVPRIMGSTTSACLTTAFGIQGISCSITSACATSAHCIGYGTELIQFNKQDVMIVGGAEEVRWTTTAPFDAMGALSTRYNNITASRPYDANRDGFVIAGGAGILILEELEHARRRNAPIYAEITGYGACSDGQQDMVTPSIQGSARAMRLALAESQNQSISDMSIDYINAHATSTPIGDICELNAIQEVFGSNIPLISSTKGLTGHPIATSAVHEAIYAMLMLKHEFIAGCTNIHKLDSAIKDMPILTKNIDRRINTIMSNSFGFGGTNASLIFQRLTH